MSTSEADQEAARSAAIASEQAGGGMTDDEFMKLTGQYHFLYKDSDVMDVLKKEGNEHLLPLIFTLSHMLRTSRITDKKVKEILKLRWHLTVRLQLRRGPREDRLASMAMFYSLCNFGDAAIEDAWQGWRGKLLTERRRAYSFESQQPQKKSFWRRFG